MTRGHNAKRFDADIIVVGAGSAGLISAYIAAALKARVILIESGAMGGDCLNTGCVPSKALIAAARRAHYARASDTFGIDTGGINVDFSRVMAHVRAAVSTVAPADSVERYERLGVRCVAGEAQFEDPWTVRVGAQRYRGRNFIIATGAEPRLPAVPGLEATPHLTSATLWQLDSLPARLAVLGGGPIGCELAQAFARLGSTVSLFEMQPRLLGAEDADVGQLLARRFGDEGIAVHAGARVESVTAGRLEFSEGQRRDSTTFDALLVATGRTPRIEGFGLGALGVRIEHGAVRVNPFLQTNYSHIYACGDVAGPYQFTHAASYQAWHAAANALFRPLWRFRIDYACLPWAVYTDPEIGRVGLNEAEAEKRGTSFEKTVFPMADLDRAITEGERDGFVKILTRRGSDRIIGASIVSSHAGELISTLSLAMTQRIGLGKLVRTVVPYPAWTEALKRASGNWKTAHAPRWVFPWLSRYHRLRRGR